MRLSDAKRSQKNLKNENNEMQYRSASPTAAYFPYMRAFHHRELHDYLLKDHALKLDVSREACETTKGFGEITAWRCA